MSKTRIGLVDDKAVNRETIVEKLGQFENLQLSFIAESGMDCLEQLQRLPKTEMPQVIFMDLEMPGLSGIETIAKARQLYPEIYFIVLTVFDDDDKLFDAIKAGSHGYLLKDETAASIEKAIRIVLEYGGSPMSPAIARKALHLLSKVQIQVPATENGEQKNSMVTELLTEREKEVLQYTINGYDAKRTAEALGLSVYTVRKHIANIYEKLHVTSKGQAIQVAYRNKLI